MNKRMKKLLCALCAALMLCLTPFAALGEGWEFTIYADENGGQIKELYDQTGALVAKASIDRTPDGPVYEAREGTLQESRDEKGNLQRSYISVDGTTISEQYQEGSLSRIDYDRSGNTAYEEYYDDGMSLTYFTPDGTKGRKFYEAYSYLSYEAYTYADGTELELNYIENHVLESKFYTDAEGKEVGEYYNDQGKLDEYFVKYTSADGRSVEEWYKADHQLMSRSMSYTDADGRNVEEMYDPDDQLIYRSVCYTDAEGKLIGETYNDKGELDECFARYTNAEGCDVEEWYNADHQLKHRTIYKGDALQRRERYDVDPEAGYYLKELSTGYQENGVDYVARETYFAWMVEEENGEVRVGTDRFAIAVSHEEEGKEITCHYSIVYTDTPLRDSSYTVTYPLDGADKEDVILDFTTVEFTDEADNTIFEYYNPDGKLTERVIRDADYNVISDEYYDEAWKKEQEEKVQSTRRARRL